MIFLQRGALELGFPPLVLYLCILVHKGPRLLQADALFAEPIQPKRGIIAGCPFGCVFAKLVLWTLMAHVNQVLRPQNITTWIHDIGIDVNAFTPLAAAEKGVHVITEVLKGLQAKGLVASMRKSGFVVSDAQTAKVLKSLLKHFPEYPQVRDYIKDLGMDCALGRKRRVGTHLSVLPKGHVAWGASNCWPLLPARNLST